MFWPVGSPAFPIWVLISLFFSQDNEMKKQKNPFYFNDLIRGSLSGYG